jgi:hypothetical protein
MRMKPTVYIETTIPSYYVARPSRDLVLATHQELTREWWDRASGSFSLFMSDFVRLELAAGARPMAEQRLALVAALPLLDASDEVADFAMALLQSRVIPETAFADASHIAVATVHRMDYLLTWNCRHINNATIKRQLGRLAMAAGYELPVICTPEELLGTGDET